MNLSDIRKDIDGIDEELISLVSKRMECSLKVAEWKRENGKPVFDRQREEEILERVEAKGGKTARGVWKEMFEQSRALQYPVAGGEIDFGGEIPNAQKVGCQGVKGAYSHLTAMELYPNAEIVFFEKWSDVCDAVKKGEVEYGILPVENSWAGSVHEVYDLLIDGGLYIALGAECEIRHNLIGIKGAKAEDIKYVYSHPQAISQCADFIGGFTATSMSNTAVAVKKIKQLNDIHSAAIGSAEAAREYGLEILAKGISSSKHNTTRFVSVCRQPVLCEGAEKISVVLSLEHKSGSLYNMLSTFNAGGLNITKLESRPIKGKNFEYLFYLDIEGNLKDKNVNGVLSAVRDGLSYFKLLGNYAQKAITLE